jgi:hypothetical protein
VAKMGNLTDDGAAARWDGAAMPRYVVHRTAPQSLDVTTPDGVIWLHSYVTTDGRASFSVYDAPNLESIPRGAGDRVAEVEVLDPFLRP